MEFRKYLKRVGKMVLIATMAISISASARTKSPYATVDAGITKVRVKAWFNSGWKTTKDDTVYGVKKGKYIKQCWVRIKEGNYDKTVYSEAFTKAEAGNGDAELSKVNNPIRISTGTWGWKYN